MTTVGALVRSVVWLCPVLALALATQPAAAQGGWLTLVNPANASLTARLPGGLAQPGGPQALASPADLSHRPANRLGEGMLGTTIGRIRVDALLGEGGMGAVYRGYDELLERPVALKTLPPEGLARAELRARFLREARLLSRLNHPNICAVHDLIQGPDADYLVLEYLDGRTLREIPTAEFDRERRLDVAEQVAVALAAAHRERIVHRDVKPENVMLTRAGQVKVLDFGVARSLGEAHRRTERTFTLDGLPDRAATPPDLARTTTELLGASAPPTLPEPAPRAALTRAGAVLGTLRYMSPEQAAGAEVNEASDMFSLGLLLQELFTGQPAYGDDTLKGSSSEILQRLSEGQTRPATGVEPDLALLIEQLKSRDPAGRPAAVEVARRIRDIRQRPQRERQRRRRLALVAVALVSCVAALLAWRLLRPRPLVGSERAARVAVLPFVNATGDPANDWVRFGLRSIVSGVLGHGPGVSVLDEERVARLANDLDAQGLADVGRLRRLAQALGADLVVGAVARGAAGTWSFDATTVTSGGSVGRHELQGRDLGELGNALAGRVTRRIDPESAAGDVRDVFSADPLLNRMYAIGIQRMQSAGARMAGPYFDVCLDREPDFAWARLRQGEIAEKLGEWPRAAEQYGQVLEQSRRRGDARLEALTHERLATLFTHRGQYDEAASQSQAALALHERLGDVPGLARVSFQAGYGAYTQGRYDQARSSLARALELFRQASDRASEAEVLRTQGLVHLNSGEVEPADELFHQALQLSESVGDVEQAAKAQVNLGLVAILRGQLGPARELLAQALRVFRQRGDRRSELVVLNNMAALQVDLGEFEAAERTVRDVLPLAQTLGDKTSEASALVNLAFFDARLGRLTKARAELAQGLQVGTWVQTASQTLFVRARVEYESGHYRAAASLLRDMRAKAGSSWERSNVLLLERFEAAARLGRRVPLPAPDR